VEMSCDGTEKKQLSHGQAWVKQWDENIGRKWTRNNIPFLLRRVDPNHRNWKKIIRISSTWSYGQCSEIKF